MLNKLIKFQTPLPPMLSNNIGILSQKRFIKLTYEGTKPFWSDGKSGATFSYYAVFQPFIEHPTIAINLLDNDVDLGTDDSEPTHAILLDRKENYLYLGSISQVKNILKNYQETLQNYPKPDWNKREEIVNEYPQRAGMFEFMMGITQQQHLEAINLIQWLDNYINDDLLNQLVSASNNGYSKAYFIINKFMSRLQ